MSKEELNRPSSLDRRIACTGSAIFEPMFPDKTISKPAEVGNKLHKLLETGETPDNLEPDELWNLETARKQIDKLVNDLKEKTGNDVEVYQELPVEISLGFDKFTKGTADLVLVSSDMIVVIDYKSGRVKVDKASYQLQAYALGVSQKYYDKNIKVVVGVCQPFAYKEIQIMSFDKEHAENVFKELLNNQKESPYNLSTGNHCKYCDYRTKCPARNHENGVLVERTKEISVEQVPQFLERYSLLKGILEDCHKKAKQMIKEGLVPDYEIKIGKGTRKINDINGLFNSWKNYLTPDEMLELCSVSISKFINVAHRKLKDAEEIKTLKEAKFRTEKAIEDFVSYGSPKETIQKKIEQK